MARTKSSKKEYCFMLKYRTYGGRFRPITKGDRVTHNIHGVFSGLMALTDSMKNAGLRYIKTGRISIDGKLNPGPKLMQHTEHYSFIGSDTGCREIFGSIKSNITELNLDSYVELICEEKNPNSVSKKKTSDII